MSKILKGSTDYKLLELHHYLKENNISYKTLPYDDLETWQEYMLLIIPKLWF